MKKAKKIAEEIGRNYKTIDPTPIDFFHDERVKVEIFPSYNQQYAVSIEVPSLGVQTPLRTFYTEAEAETWARNIYTEYVTKLDSLKESIYTRILDL